MKMSENKIFIVASFFILLGAIFSDGFYHLDEHYQILEFASYKLGISGLHDMPWEFHEKMRPTIQPWIAYYTHRMLAGFGNNNPLVVAMALRLLSGILALFTIRILYQSLKKHFEDQYKFLLFGVGMLLWFNPYLLVRFSSENWGGMLFFIATALLVADDGFRTRNLWITGAILGISFFIRFQMAFAIFGIIGFLVYSRKISAKALLYLVSGGILAISFMVYLDYLFYETFVFTPWEYFKQNIILDKASNFGTEPWWMYFGWLIEEAYLPVAAMIIFGLYQLLKNRELAILNWIWIPFFVGHCLVGHKELRFFFPMIYLVPYAIIESWKKIASILSLNKTYIKITIVALLTWNFGLYIYCSVTPAKSFVRMYAEMRNIVEPNSVVYLASNKNENWNYPLKYFVDPSIDIIRADSNVTVIQANDRPHYVWVKKSELKISQSFLGDSVTATIPQWLYLFDFNGWVGRERNFVLYRVKE